MISALLSSTFVQLISTFVSPMYKYLKTVNPLRQPEKHIYDVINNDLPNNEVINDDLPKKEEIKKEEEKEKEEQEEINKGENNDDGKNKQKPLIRRKSWINWTEEAILVPQEQILMDTPITQQDRGSFTNTDRKKIFDLLEKNFELSHAYDVDDNDKKEMRDLLLEKFDDMNWCNARNLVDHLLKRKQFENTMKNNELVYCTVYNNEKKRPAKIIKFDPDPNYSHIYVKETFTKSIWINLLICLSDPEPYLFEDCDTEIEIIDHISDNIIKDLITKRKSEEIEQIKKECGLSESDGSSSEEIKLMISRNLDYGDDPKIFIGLITKFKSRIKQKFEKKTLQLKYPPR